MLERPAFEREDVEGLVSGERDVVEGVAFATAAGLEVLADEEAEFTSVCGWGSE